MMVNSEKFCLKWNDFDVNISTAFRELREDKEFFDVTLVCDEDQIQAHKVILSACSPFFRSILKRNRHEHPLLYLKDVKFCDIVSVLNFMYQGEVNVAQEELNSFLAVAEDLKVKGLTQNEPPGNIIKPKHDQKQILSQKGRERREYHQVPAPTTYPSNLQAQPLSSHTFSSAFQDDDIQEIVPVKSEPGGLHQSLDQEYIDNASNSGGVVAAPNDDDTIYDEYADYDYGDNQAYLGESSQRSMGGAKDTDALIASYMQKITDEKRGQMWECVKCGKTSRYITNLKDHVEANHLEGLTYQCPECPKISKSRQSLRAHMKTTHNLSSKDLKYNCR